MVNWKSPESTDRLIAALLATHQGIKLDYHAMALLFDQGATFDALEARFRRYRKMADELKADAYNRGITDIPHNVGRNISVSGGNGNTTPRTPRGARGGITSSINTPSSSSKRKRGTQQAQTPTKQKKNKPGMSLMDAIYVEDADPDEEFNVKLKFVGSPSGGEDDDVVVVDAPLASAASISKIKREKFERNTPGFAFAKKEEEKKDTAFGISATAARRGIRNHDSAAHYSAGVEEDPFGMAGGYTSSFFDHVKADYDIGNVYGGEA
ncbi:hypothetical protein BDV23DRAFT_185529 [Aspergillus alliaceus]|uniref:Uncharacterized protein n=1 Tax=Petromyces alliaceus TaxID=209559 RepID=A0A5N7C2R8_PETAA|nr:hypothetical protein BDV23DRAFT_185529 [Aspergillus alliaceus]